jgi:AraC-like DNA-binding protein/ligand-binding sensor protein
VQHVIPSGGTEPRNKTTTANLIGRREIEPVLLQAQKAAATYEEATGCSVIVLDHTGLPANGVHAAGAVKEARFCTVCKRSHPGTQRRYYYLCVSAHLEALKEAKPEGSSYVYVCERGIAFWISPFYSGGRYIGAFLAGTVRIAETHETYRQLPSIDSEDSDSSTREIINEYYEAIPKKTHTEIDALSRLLLACAAAVSESPEDLLQELTEPQVKPEPDLPAAASPEQTIVEPAAKKEIHKEDTLMYPLDRERVLLASLRRGDNETGRRILRELLDAIQIASPGNFNFIRFRATELVVLLSRIAAVGGENGRVIFEANNRYVRRIQGSATMEELSENVHHIVDRLSEHIFLFQGMRHASALRRAERFIWAQYTRKITLPEIAEISGLSPAYFSTVFKEEMGETFSTYVNRLRVEKAAMMLTDTKRSLFQIAKACGFEDQSWFTRIFKLYAGTSPGKYRERGGSLNELEMHSNRMKKG